MASKRAQVLTLIRAEVATAGEISRYALRLYIENRISRMVFNEAVEQGMKIYHSAKLKGANNGF